MHTYLSKSLTPRLHQTYSLQSKGCTTGAASSPERRLLSEGVVEYDLVFATVVCHEVGNVPTLSSGCCLRGSLVTALAITSFLTSELYEAAFSGSFARFPWVWRLGKTGLGPGSRGSLFCTTEVKRNRGLHSLLLRLSWPPKGWWLPDPPWILWPISHSDKVEHHVATVFLHLFWGLVLQDYRKGEGTLLVVAESKGI